MTEKKPEGDLCGGDQRGRVMGLAEVAEILGISVSRVQQIEAKAIRKLKRNRQVYRLFLELVRQA